MSYSFEHDLGEYNSTHYPYEEYYDELKKKLASTKIMNTLGQNYYQG